MTTLQNIPLFVLQHKWSSDVDSNVQDNFISPQNCINLFNRKLKLLFFYISILE